MRRQSLGFAEGMILGLGRGKDPREAKVFDWDKAARLIRERQPKTAEAGLAQDWDCTAGTIYQNGAPVPKDDTYTYLKSNWATPLLVIDEEEVECWVPAMESKWDSGTYWPESALQILTGMKRLEGVKP